MGNVRARGTVPLHLKSTIMKKREKTRKNDLQKEMVKKSTSNSA